MLKVLVGTWTTGINPFICWEYICHCIVRCWNLQLNKLPYLRVGVVIILIYTCIWKLYMDPHKKLLLFTNELCCMENVVGSLTIIYCIVYCTYSVELWSGKLSKVIMSVVCIYAWWPLFFCQSGRTFLKKFHELLLGPWTMCITVLFVIHLLYWVMT